MRIGLSTDWIVSLQDSPDSYVVKIGPLRIENAKLEWLDHNAYLWRTSIFRVDVSGLDVYQDNTTYSFFPGTVGTVTSTWGAPSLTGWTAPEPIDGPFSDGVDMSISTLRMLDLRVNSYVQPQNDPYDGDWISEIQVENYVVNESADELASYGDASSVLIDFRDTGYNLKFIKEDAEQLKITGSTMEKLGPVHYFPWSDGDPVTSQEVDPLTTLTDVRLPSWSYGIGSKRVDILGLTHDGVEETILDAGIFDTFTVWSDGQIIDGGTFATYYNGVRYKAFGFKASTTRFGDPSHGPYWDRRHPTGPYLAKDSYTRKDPDLSMSSTLSVSGVFDVTTSDGYLLSHYYETIADEIIPIIQSSITSASNDGVDTTLNISIDVVDLSTRIFSAGFAFQILERSQGTQSASSTDIYASRTVDWGLSGVAYSDDYFFMGSQPSGMSISCTVTIQDDVRFWVVGQESDLDDFKDSFINDTPATLPFPINSHNSKLFSELSSGLNEIIGLAVNSSKPSFSTLTIPTFSISPPVPDDPQLGTTPEERAQKKTWVKYQTAITMTDHTRQDMYGKDITSGNRNALTVKGNAGSLLDYDLMFLQNI